MTHSTLRQMLLASLFAALTAVCAWLAVPLGDGAFTLQTLAVFLALGVLGGRWGSISIGIYLLLGAAGVPVFSGFRGGMGALLGPTGGYLLGFLALGLIYRGVTAFFGERARAAALILGLLGCYAFGTVWYWALYAGGGFWAVAARCVAPYLVPDALKLALALGVIPRLRRHLPI